MGNVGLAIDTKEARSFTTDLMAEKSLAPVFTGTDGLSRECKHDRNQIPLRFVDGRMGWLSQVMPGMVRLSQHQHLLSWN